MSDHFRRGYNGRGYGGEDGRRPGASAPRGRPGGYHRPPPVYTRPTAHHEDRFRRTDDRRRPEGDGRRPDGYRERGGQRGGSRGGHDGRVAWSDRGRGWTGNQRQRPGWLTSYAKPQKVCRGPLLHPDDREGAVRLAGEDMDQLGVFVIGHEYVRNFFEHATTEAVREYRSLEQWLGMDHLVGRVYYHGVPGALVDSPVLVPAARLRQLRPAIVVLDIGSNDVDTATDPRLITDRIVGLARAVKEEYRPWVVVLCSVVERRALLKHTDKEYYMAKAKQVNAQLNAACLRVRGVEFFRHKVCCDRKFDDWHADGIHPDVTLGAELYKRTMKRAILGVRTELKCAQIEARNQLANANVDWREAGSTGTPTLTTSSDNGNQAMTSNMTRDGGSGLQNHLILPLM